MSEACDAAPANPHELPGEQTPAMQQVATLVSLDLAIDQNGSPVTLDPVDWLICFVPGLRREWWHWLAHRKHKHVFAMRPLNTGSWLLVEPWWSRMMVTTLAPTDALKFLKWGSSGDILRVRERIPGSASQLRGWSNCAVLTAFVLGRSSWAWTPHSLYLELLREQETEHVNVEQLLADQFAKIAKTGRLEAIQLPSGFQVDHPPHSRNDNAQLASMHSRSRGNPLATSDLCRQESGRERAERSNTG